jgi:hypothetical protein
MNIHEDKLIERSVTVGRRCDNCGFEELSDRIQVKFDHTLDNKWAKVQLSLSDYTSPHHNREYHLCSKECLREFSFELANVYALIQGDSSLSGVPLAWVKELYEEQL